MSLQTTRHNEDRISLEWVNQESLVKVIEASPEDIRNRINHMMWFATNSRDKARDGVLESVDVLVLARKKVDQAENLIRNIRGICPHDEECVGRSPAGSFTAEYFRCKVCGWERADD